LKKDRSTDAKLSG